MGHLFFDLSTDVNALVEVPHPLFDSFTLNVGIEVFRTGQARGLLIPGAHRNANGTGTADVAHLTDSIFHQVHKAWSGSHGQNTAWQIHGFNSANHPAFPSDTDVVLSSGDGSVTTDLATLDATFQDFLLSGYIFNNLDQADPSNVKVNDGEPGNTFSALGAVTNVQGQYSRGIGGQFIHVELAESIRFDTFRLVDAGFLMGQAMSSSRPDRIRFINAPNIEVDVYDGGRALSLFVKDGQTATPADFEAVLKSLTFQNLSDNPSGSAREVSITYKNSYDASNVYTRLIDVQPENDAPIARVPLTVPPALFQTSDGQLPVNNWLYQLQGLGGPLEVNPLAAAQHDLVVMDFSQDGTEAAKFTAAEVADIKNSATSRGGDGHRKAVAAYLSIGEASDFRSHWDASWTDTGTAAGNLTINAPAWLGPLNPDFPESRKVRYWDTDWQSIIFNEQRTGWLDQIVDQGFDAAYLDIVLGYYFWGVEVDPSDRAAGDPPLDDDARDAGLRMIDFIVKLTEHARQTNPHFFVIPQNGAFLINDALQGGDPLRCDRFLDAIGGIAVEDTYFRGNQPENNAFDPDMPRVQILQQDFLTNGKPVFVVDYVNQASNVEQFHEVAVKDGFHAFAAPSRQLDREGPVGPRTQLSPLTVLHGDDLVIEGVHVADVDAAFADVQVTLSVDDGTINVKADVVNGLRANHIVGNGTNEVTLTGPVALINSTFAAAALVYRGVTGFSGADEFRVMVDDNGQSGAGSNGQFVGRVAIEVLPSNRAPSDLEIWYGFVPETADPTTSSVTVGTLSATDLDEDELTFALVSGAGDADNAAFEIDGDVLKLRQGTVLDPRVQDRYLVRVEVSDGEFSAAAALLVDVGLPVGDLIDRSIPHTQTRAFRFPATNRQGQAIDYAAELTGAHPLEIQALELDSRLGLRFTGSYSENWGGAGEKWMQRTSGDWYFITPTGALHQWTGAATGSGFLTGSPFVASFDASFHADPSKLHDAPAPAPLSGSTATLNASRLVVDPGTDFRDILFVTMSATDPFGSVTQTFAVTVTDAPPVLDLEDQVMSHTVDTLTIDLAQPDADGETIAYTASLRPSNEQLAYDLDQQLGLRFTGSYNENWGGAGEKWMQSRDGTWHFITPDGTLYRWTGAPTGSQFLSGSILIATLDPSFHADPTLLHDAPEPAGDGNTVSIVDSRLVVDPAVDFLGDLFVTVTAADAMHIVERTFRVTVTDSPILNLPDREISHTAMLTIDLPATDVDGDPLTYSASIATSDAVEILAYQLDQDLGLQFSGTYIENWGGAGEKWMLGSTGLWYFITPSGDLYRWAGAPSGASFLPGSISVATLDSSYHADPTKLHDAPQVHSDILGSTVIVNGTELVVDPGTDFRGNLSITVTVTDGLHLVIDTFRVTVTDAPPVLDLPNREISHTVDTLIIDLPALDADGESIRYTSAIQTVLDLAYSLDRSLGLRFTGSYTENWGGANERWMQSSAGAWHFITPDGGFYRWTGAASGAGFLAGSPRIATLDSSLHADPRRLHDAQPPASPQRNITAELDGTRLTVDPGVDFRGEARVTVTAADAMHVVTRTFTVNVIDSPPELDLPDVVIPHTVDTVTIDLPETDADGEVLAYRVSLASVNQTELAAYNLDRQLGLSFSGSYLQNWGGADEKWMISASGTWHFITPDGNVYQWLGAASGAGFLTGSALVETLDSSFHSNPSKLHDAPPPSSNNLFGSTASIHRSQLIVDPGQQFRGEMQVTVTAEDAQHEVTENFKLTVIEGTSRATVGSTSGSTGSSSGGRSSFTLTDPETGRLRTIRPFSSAFIGEIRLATGDFNGDGQGEIIAAAGPGGGPHVQVFRAWGNMVQDFFAYDPSFQGGVFVDSADFNRDGVSDIVTGAGPGGGPHVKVFDGSNPGNVLFSFFAYEPSFIGGVRVAVGDVSGDGVPDIVTVPGPSGGPNVRVFDGRTGESIQSFFAFDPTFAGGVFVDVGNFNDDQFADIVTGAGPGGGPHVKVFSGKDDSLLGEFFAYDAAFRGGVQVTVADLTDDGISDIVVGPGNGGSAVGRQLFNGATFRLDSNFAPNDLGRAGSVFDDIATRKPRRLSVIDPTLNGVTADLTPTITWTNDRNAARFDLSVVNLETNVSVIRQRDLVTNSFSFTPISDLSQGRYDIRVRAANSDNEFGPWSRPHAIEITIRTPQRPVPTGPAGFIDDATPSFTWTQDIHTDSVELSIVDSSSGVEVIRQRDIRTGSWVPESPLPAAEYRYNLQAWNQLDIRSGWTRSVIFTIDAAIPDTAPVITSPAAGTVRDATPSMAWNNVANATHYDLQLTDRESGTAVITRTGLATTSFTPQAPLPEGAYRLEVTPINSIGTAGPAAFVDFSIDVPAPNRPEIVLPSSIAPNPRPTFAWVPQPDVVEYQLWVSNDTAGVPRYLRLTGVRSNQATAHLDFTPGNYRVWVKAISIAGEHRWSHAHSFTISADTTTD